MASIINSTTTAGVTVTGDNSGSLQLATNNGTTAVTIDTSQRVAFVAGTAALPAITTTGDTNTGIFFPAADTIAFSEGGAEAMRIDSSGNVGVGIASPTARLHVYGGSNNQFKVESSGAEANFTLAGTSYGQINNTTGDLYITTDAASTNLIFRTVSTERMRITSGGGTRFQCQNFAAQPSSTNGGVEINNTNSGSVFFGFGTGTETQIAFGNTNGIRGTIQTTSGGTSYNTTSDYRLKENVASMTGALAKVSQLKPSTYTWKVDGSNGQGFIAHELQEVIPDCVTGEKDGFEDVGTITDANGDIVSTNVKEPHSIGEELTWTKTGSEPKYQMVDTSFLVATLTAAIQELNAKVDAQAVRIAELEGAK